MIYLIPHEVHAMSEFRSNESEMNLMKNPQKVKTFMTKTQEFAIIQEKKLKMMKLLRNNVTIETSLQIVSSKFSMF